MGGMAKDVDVQILVREIGVPAEGELIEYGRLEGILRLPRSKTRWRTIVRAWIRWVEREHNVMLTAVPNVGYVRGDNHARVDVIIAQHQSGIRRIVRAAVRAAATERDGLDPNDVAHLEHIERMPARLR